MSIEQTQPDHAPVEQPRNASCTVSGHEGYPARNCPGCRIDQLLIEADEALANAPRPPARYHRPDDL